MGLLAVPSFVGIVGAGAYDFGNAQPPQVEGDYEKGSMVIELHRGAAVPDEIVVIPTGQNCEGNLTAEISWDEQKNTVDVHLKGEQAFIPNPTLIRTEGVDYFPNQFWPEGKDIVNGRYQLWIIHVAGEADYYYDGTTLDLLGSQFDFDTPPAGAITVRLPYFNALPTDFIEVQPDGSVDWTTTLQYDHMVRGDQPDYSHLVATFIPHTLCKAHPTDYTQTSSRPYSSPRPASEAESWDEWLRNGVILDITVEPPEYPVWPPRSSNVASYSGSWGVAGGIPNGWTLDIEAAFANLAPPIRPWPAAGTCEPWFKPVRDRDFNICQGGAQ